MSPGTSAVLGTIICGRTGTTRPEECALSDDLPDGAAWPNPGPADMALGERFMSPGAARFAVRTGRRLPEKHPGAITCTSDTPQENGAIVEGGFYFLGPAESGNQMLQAKPDPTFCD